MLLYMVSLQWLIVHNFRNMHDNRIVAHRTVYDTVNPKTAHFTFSIAIPSRVLTRRTKYINSYFCSSSTPTQQVKPAINVNTVLKVQYGHAYKGTNSNV